MSAEVLPGQRVRLERCHWRLRYAALTGTVVRRYGDLAPYGRMWVVRLDEPATCAKPNCTCGRVIGEVVASERWMTVEA